MKSCKRKSVFRALLASFMLAALCFEFISFQGAAAYADEASDGENAYATLLSSSTESAETYANETNGYEGAYRNRLAFSAKEGWNNDPNGLLYANGVWHMYYQYNYDWRDGHTENGWGNMSWGHATSADLVHWEEKPVAIPAYQNVGEGENQQWYAMMFSGSAVYDENNTSGFFDTDGNGKVVDGQGIIAVLTQPCWDEARGYDVQRQILAYSKDDGESFTIYGEVVSADNDGGIGDNEFRDPKVFWNEKLNKWLMAVGGGSVRMYSSDNLKEWAYLGQTGYWGECPDLSRYEVDGEEKYVLIISPEDKNKSHEYNKTTRADAYYPAEYYVVGDLDENGLFVSDKPVRRLSEGIDSYAFQSFNNSPDGKVYGVSWAASWKTCGLYEGFRETHNGGMTVITQLGLIKENGSYVLTRTPVDQYADLRGERVTQYSGTLAKDTNALAGVSADVADLEIELDFNGSNATSAELWLRVSAVEKIKLTYSVADGRLTLDRSQSSLLAKDTSLYTVPYSKKVDLIDGKLSLRVLLDRAFVSVFANGGKASFFSAVFPSAISNGMKLTADGDLSVTANVYKLNGIFTQSDSDGLIVTTDKIDGTVGNVYPVIASSFSENFDLSDVSFSVIDGQDNVALETVGGIAYVKVLQKGYAKIRAEYGGQGREIDVYCYYNGWVSQINYDYNVGGFSYYGDNGLFLANDGDAFRFSAAEGKNFIYSAEYTPDNDDAQAAGIVFGVSDNLTSYWVATADTKENKVKLWQAGVGDLKTVDYTFETGKKFKITVVMNGDVAKIFIDDDVVAAIVCRIGDYVGGKLGLNVFGGSFVINNVKFTDLDVPEGDMNCNGYEVLKVVNISDGNYKLNGADYTLNGGILKISDEYLKTLEANTEYTFRVVTSFTDFDVTVKTDFTAVTATPAVEKYYKDDDVTLELSDSVTVNRLFIDGKEYAFTQTEDRVVISSDEIGSLTMGSHTVKLYTDKGRPETTITVSEIIETVADPVEQSARLWLWIDVAIFASAIVVYTAFSIVSKRKKK